MDYLLWHAYTVVGMHQTLLIGTLALLQGQALGAPHHAKSLTAEFDKAEKKIEDKIHQDIVLERQIFDKSTPAEKRKILRDMSATIKSEASEGKRLKHKLEKKTAEIEASASESNSDDDNSSDDNSDDSASGEEN